MMVRSHTTFTRLRRGFTLVELVLVLAVIAILAALAMVNYQRAVTRARVSATLSNIRTMMTAMESYRIDHGVYPTPIVSLWDDPLGVVSSSAMSALTTPIAYASQAAFSDPFGSTKIEGALDQRDMFGLPVQTFNAQKSMLVFSYPNVSMIVNRPRMDRDGYAIVSVGPDSKDSFIVYYPFPRLLPTSASAYGVNSIQDTVYDPSNGTISPGDLAGFGGDLSVSPLHGGGVR